MKKTVHHERCSSTPQWALKVAANGVSLRSSMLSSVVFGAKVLLFLCSTSAAVQAQVDSDAFGNLIESPDDNQPLQRTERPSVGVAPLVGRMSFNGTNLEFADKWIWDLWDLSVEGGSRSNAVAGREIDFIFGRGSDERLVSHATGATFESSKRASIIQLRSADKSRTVTTSSGVEGNLLGFNLQFTATGRCFLPGPPADSFCTYTPGISTVDGGYNADSLVPNAFSVTSQFGQEIGEDVHESLKLDGFQRGEDIEGAALVGLHFDVPRAGFMTGEGPLKLQADRRSETERRLLLSFGMIDQTIASNNREAAATRSARALIVLDKDEWDATSVAMQLLGQLLPTAPSGLDQVPGVPNLAISNNLFYALNNARVPAESFTVFQTGRAEVQHGSAPARSAAETPTASYSGVWMGFTPVRTGTMTMREQFIPTSERTSLSEPVFRQGGGDTQLHDLVATNFLLADDVEQTLSRVNFENIDDVFIQVGLDATTQQAIHRMTMTETSEFRLVPHIAVDGNRTGGESVLRYYGGAILGDDTNAYLGADYLLQTESGWNAFTRLDLYSSPDEDYFSEVEARASRTVALQSGRQLTIGAGAVAALDDLNRSRVSNSMAFRSNGRQHGDLVMRLRDGSIDYTLRQRYASTPEGDWQKSTTLGVSFAPNNRFFVSAQFTPSSTEDTRIKAGAELNWRMGEGEQSNSVLQMQISRIEYDLGKAPDGSNFGVSENTFRLGLQARF